MRNKVKNPPCRVEVLPLTSILNSLLNCRMTRKLFGLYRSYRLGVADVFGMVMLGLLVLAAIAIAISTTTTNVHPGMLGLGVVVVVIIMFTLICG